MYKEGWAVVLRVADKQFEYATKWCDMNEVELRSIGIVGRNSVHEFKMLIPNDCPAFDPGNLEFPVSSDLSSRKMSEIGSCRKPDYNPSHKCLESRKLNPDHLAFVVQLPECS